MNERTLRMGIAVGLIIAHFLTIVLIVCYWYLDKFDVDQVETMVTMIVPMFAVYSTTIINFLRSVKYKTTENSNSVTGIYASVTIIIPIVFIGSILLMLYAIGNGILFSSFDQFMHFLTGTEFGFGIYMGWAIHSLYEQSPIVSTLSNESNQNTPNE
jgi:hypothetical protein